MIFSPRRAASIARKEARHIWRDPFTMTLALGLPTLMVMFFGYAIDFDVRDVSVEVFDHDGTRPSREVAAGFAASPYFQVRAGPVGGDPILALHRERAKAVVVIEPGFGRSVRGGEAASVQVLVDGADNAVAGVLSGYLEAMRPAVARRLGLPDPQAPARLESRFLFNPGLDSRWFVVPGLAVIVMGIIAVLLTALTVAKEWEVGSMELLLSTPVQPLEIVLGKLMPYMAMGVGALLFVYAAARLVFGVPFMGSHALFAVCALLYLAAMLSQGLVISVVTRQQQLAMQLALMTGLLPVQLLSGFVFPVQSMPAPFRLLAGILPARWFMDATRALFLKGSGSGEVARPMAALILLAAAFVTVAMRRFKKDLEP